MDPAIQKEEKRLSALHSLGILNSQKEERFDKITSFTSRIFGLNVCGISFVDRDVVFYKSIQGVTIVQEARIGSFSSEVLKNQGVFVVSNAQDLDIYKNSPLVMTGPKLRFFAGVTLNVFGNEPVGCFFVADRTPRDFSEVEKSTLADLSLWVSAEVMRNVTTSRIDNEEEKLKEELVARNRELMEEKARDDAMLGNIGDGVIGINDKGEVIYTNKRAEEMLGWSQNELLTKPIWYAVKMVDKDDGEVPVNQRPIRNSLYLKKRIVTTNNFYVRKDGSKFPVAVTATPAIAYNRVIGGVVIFRDVTKEKEVDRMKTEFISLASHQLRTPLSAMKWFSEILLDGDAGELTTEQKEIMGNIYQSNERMIELVNTLLNISRMESGRIIIEPIPTDLKKLIDEVVALVKPKVDVKKLHLVISVHSTLPLISIDPKMIRHVYMNLLTNAIKYTPEGGEIVVIISRQGEEIISQVSDNGYGIPKSQHDKVFKKFFRAENIVKIETDGTGLGLYLIKSIVESSGGRIWFESAEDKGTTFWFSLPILRSVTKKGEVSIDA